jgi:hypothetical protein
MYGESQLIYERLLNNASTLPPTAGAAIFVYAITASLEKP